MGDLDLLEHSTLSSVTATDFSVQSTVATGQSGLFVVATCTLLGHPNPTKPYTIKLLFDFSHHECSSTMQNTYENEWLLLSQLQPHPNIVRFWTQFVAPIPPSFVRLLPEHLQKTSMFQNHLGQIQRRKGQFLILDHHPENLSDWLNRFPPPLPFDLMLKLTDQLLQALVHLEESLIRHLDLKTSNVLMTNGERLVLRDFGCAVQFSNDTFLLKYARGAHVGGNRAHLAPEVLTAVHKCRANPSKPVTIDYSRQASFAAGILLCEIATGNHPLPDYPLSYSKQGIIDYTPTNLSPLPSFYPKSFRSIIGDLLHAEKEKRLSLSEALKQLQVCCLRRQSVSSVKELQEEIARVKQERDLATAKMSVMASDRDKAVREMKAMADKCQQVASEFDSMAQHCDQLIKENKQFQRERDSALAASESAYEASEMIQEQLSLVTRERDLAQRKCEELQLLSNRVHQNEPIRECGRCRGFFVQSENTHSSCKWHPGRHLFNRWSCCYKRDITTSGCQRARHVPKL